MPNWIPTRDRLPPEETPVRCLDGRGFAFDGVYCPRVHRSCWFRLDKHGNGFIHPAPTHWALSVTAAPCQLSRRESQEADLKLLQSLLPLPSGEVDAQRADGEGKRGQESEVTP